MLEHLHVHVHANTSYKVVYISHLWLVNAFVALQK